jgi:hypothetical protein
MSVFAMIAGKLTGEPRTVDTRNGGKVTFFRLRVANGASIEFWNVATFDDDARTLVAELSEGAPLTATGTFTVEPWEKGEKRGFNLKLTADTVLTLKPKPKPRPHKPKATSQAAESWAAPAGPREEAPLDDGIPF